MGGGTIALLVLVMLMIVGALGFALSETGSQEPTTAGLPDAPITTADRTGGPPSTEPVPSSTTRPSTTLSTPSTTVVPADPAPSVADPVDVTRFCATGSQVADFEQRLLVAEGGGDFGLLAAFVGHERQAWDEAVRAMAAAGPPDVAADVFQYALIYRAFFDAVQSSSSYEELRAKVDIAVVAAASQWGSRIKAAVEDNCA